MYIHFRIKLNTFVQKKYLEPKDDVQFYCDIHAYDDCM